MLRMKSTNRNMPGLQRIIRWTNYKFVDRLRIYLVLLIYPRPIIRGKWLVVD